MPKFKRLIKLVLCPLAAIAGNPAAMAHTSLQTPAIAEGTRVFNAVVIEHGCDDPATGTTSTPVFGESVVFPDGADSVITTKPVGAAPATPATPYAGKLTDFVQNWANANQKIQSRDVFTLEDVKYDALGNIVGFWGGNGNLPGVNYLGLIPFVTAPVLLQPASCAASATFVLGIADVCKITGIAGFNTETVNLWTPAVGSNYDGTPDTNDGYDSPVTLKVTRNQALHPLPAACGAGLDVTVTPSAAQLNRDMPVWYNGKQAWPLP